MRRVLVLTAAAGLAISACGSSGSDTGADATTATTAASASATTAAASATTAAASATTAAAAATTAAASATTAAAAAGGTTVTLKEWSVEAPALKAGAATLSVTNGGQNPHELKVIKGDSFASLPQASGAVDESKLAADAIVGKTARIDPGATATLNVTLAAGKYVLVCNLGAGAQSHAAKGQFLDVTVS